MRQEVLAQVGRVLGAVLSRRVGVSLALWGEAGIGKSHAAAELLSQLPCEHLTVPASLPITRLPELPRPRPLPDWVAQQLRGLRSGKELSGRAVVDTLIRSLMPLAPFVLHLEDWHDADPARQDLIVSLARAVKRAPGLGLLLTSRTPLPNPFLNNPLARLTAPETAALLQAQLGASLPPESLTWIHTRTDGNPLFMLEFLRYLTRQGFLWSDGQSWHWRTPPDQFVPMSVEALIEQLIAGATQDEQARRVVEARATLPPGLDDQATLEMWQTLAECDLPTFESLTRHLAKRGLLNGLEFSHPLFGEVITSRMGTRQREYVRRALDTLEPSAPELAAALLPRAEVEPERALRVLERAAQQAAGQGAQARQAHWLAQTVHLTPLPQRAGRALEAAQALHQAGQVSGALALAELASTTLPEAAVLCAELLLSQGQVGAAEAQIKALPGGVGEQRWWHLSIRHLSMRGLFAELVRLWEAHPAWQDAAPVVVRKTAGNACAVTGDLSQAERIATELMARPDLSEEETLDARNLYCHVLMLRRDPRLLEAERETIRLAREWQRPMHLGLALLNHAAHLNDQPDRPPVRTLLSEAAALYQKLGQSFHHSRCLMRLADQDMQDAQFERAETQLVEAHAIIRQHDNQQMLTECHLKQSRLYLLWRPPHGAPLALRHARLALELARTSQDQKFLQLSLRRVAQAEAWCGHAPEALAAAREALEYAQQRESPRDLTFSLQALGLALDAAGERQQATTHLRRAHDLFLELKMGMEAQHAGLEADRISGDAVQAGQRREWLLAHGHPGEASLALHFFPGLAASGPQEPAEPAPDVQLKVLGSLTLERAGKPLTYRARKRLEVLTYLLEARLSGRGEVGLLELLDTFYPGEDEVKARNTLKQQVFLIRGDLGARSVLSTASGYALGDVQSDAEDFLNGGPSSLWRGPYLGDPAGGWLATVREAISLALRNRCESLLSTHPQEAARLASFLGQMEPYDVSALHLEIRALQASGQERTAQTLYRERRQALLEVGENLPPEPPNMAASVMEVARPHPAK